MFKKNKINICVRIAMKLYCDIPYNERNNYFTISTFYNKKLIWHLKTNNIIYMLFFSQIIHIVALSLFTSHNQF